MNIRHILIAFTMAAITAGCSDDQLGTEEPNRPVEPSRPAIDDTTKEPISLHAGAMGLTSTVGTRGIGTVGDIAGSNANVWHSEQLYIYAVNRYATNLTSEYVDNDHEIPTFLKGGWLQQNPAYSDISAWGGDPAIAPAGLANGSIEFRDSVVVYRYYPLNGAYNFMGYHIDNAKILSSGITPDNKAVEIKLELDGTQDIMVGKAQLTSQDTVRFIQSLIASDKLDSAAVSKYYDADNHRLSLELTDDQYKVIEKELTERHYSSYANRRDVMPSIDFRHQLSRLTFQVVGGNSNAVTRLSNRPKIHFRQWIQKRYMPGEFFSYRNKLYYVKKDTQDELSEAELFDNQVNKKRFLKCIDFSLAEPKQMGDTVAYNNELYTFMNDYDGMSPTWEKLEPHMNNITSPQLKFTEGRDYLRGDCVISPTDSCWVLVKDVVAASSWGEVQSNAIEFRQGVFVSKIELLAQHNQGTISMNPDTIVFKPAVGDDDSTATYVLKQHASSDFVYGDSLVDLEPTGPEYTLEQYGTDDRLATRVGESMMVMPGEMELFANIYVTEYVDMYGNLVGSVDIADDSNTKIYKNTRIRANKEGTAIFEPGKSYMVTLTVYALQGLEVTTNLVAWNVGGSIDIDPEDQLFNVLNAINMPLAFSGISETVPAEDYLIRQGTSWKDKDLRSDVIEYDRKGVHWFALREEYEVSQWLNLDNSRDYLNPKFNQLKKSDIAYVFTINIDATRKKEFVYRLYYTTDSRGVAYTNESRRYQVKIKDAPKQ